ncbi:hypothetical protein PYCCODRAFT_155208 [Trametes coccinea BRFM310]|uniref:Uncharacterized protein n=1 Tax=Trametes coccinea (strain BRFM310) TaxID=1353009 RepID=A0A1Y2I8K8_TRAC3|nr:hypothetical protein PYCCODRAFT_155208 [Trametes coccinea BRFM310]
MAVHHGGGDVARVLRACVRLTRTARRRRSDVPSRACDLEHARATKTVGGMRDGGTRSCTRSRRRVVDARARVIAQRRVRRVRRDGDAGMWSSRLKDQNPRASRQVRTRAVRALTPMRANMQNASRICQEGAREERDVSPSMRARMLSCAVSPVEAPLGLACGFMYLPTTACIQCITTQRESTAIPTQSSRARAFWRPHDMNYPESHEPGGMRDVVSGRSSVDAHERDEKSMRMHAMQFESGVPPDIDLHTDASSANLTRAVDAAILIPALALRDAKYQVLARPGQAHRTTLSDDPPLPTHLLAANVKRSPLAIATLGRREIVAHSPSIHAGAWSPA